MVDSRGITSQIRQDILQAIKTSKCKDIIVTHGTYTMADTAKWIQENIGATDKRIIFVGSFYPLTGFCPNDAGFNLGFAIGIISFLRAGVYVAMNAEIFDPSEVKKDTIQGKFVK